MPAVGCCCRVLLYVAHVSTIPHVCARFCLIGSQWGSACACLCGTGGVQGLACWQACLARCMRARTVWLLTGPLPPRTLRSPLRALRPFFMFCTGCGALADLLRVGAVRRWVIAFVRLWAPARDGWPCWRGGFPLFSWLLVGCLFFSGATVWARGRVIAVCLRGGRPCVYLSYALRRLAHHPIGVCSSQDTRASRSHLGEAVGLIWYVLSAQCTCHCCDHVYHCKLAVVDCWSAPKLTSSSVASFSACPRVSVTCSRCSLHIAPCTHSSARRVIGRSLAGATWRGICRASTQRRVLLPGPLRSLVLPNRH